MALLHYENLGVPDAGRLLKSAFFGLGDFFKYLDVTIKYLEDEAAVLRLAWQQARAPQGYARGSQGVWIELRGPDDRPDEPEPTFDAFLDEDLRSVFELERDTGKVGAKRRVSMSPDRRIDIRDRDPGTNRLLLERLPELPELFLAPNTTTLRRQREAVKQLQDAPAASHLPLLRLFEPSRHARWPASEALTAPLVWQVLLDPTRPGTEEQRRFVAVALQTPDFAFLEGPPGSGKTTAICELILQLVSRGQRVLLCASTHVAVDNVLERVGPLALKDQSDLIPVRVGDANKLSDAAKPFQLQHLVETERQRILEFLRARNPRTPAQEQLFQVISRRGTDHEPDAIQRMILDAANLVCGTTTGILRHPDIRNTSATGRAGMFDVLIVDEASKTTFQEMLVPALLANRWIVVGDPRQLSPYIDEAGMAANLMAAVPQEVVRNACVDVFLAAADGETVSSRRRAAVVTETGEDDWKAYEVQAAARGVTVTTPDDVWVGLAEIVLGSPEAIAADEDRLPADVGTVRGAVPESTARQARAFRGRIQVRDEDPPRWEDELAWRLCRDYELRLREDSATSLRLRREAKALFPVGLDGHYNGAAERIHRVRRVAFPSVLESLQNGFERPDGQREATALSDGLPEQVWDARHVLLEHQHRMHPEISAFPREKIYGGQALKDPPDMAQRRAWTYSEDRQRALWIDVHGKCTSSNRNEMEADVVVRELRRFEQWARENPRWNTKNEAEAWEVAVLTFYRGQERMLRERLRTLTGSRDDYRTFKLRSGNRVTVRVELCTVDRFQGHEADVVFLSIANTRITNFLESTNRLNVALTRARYQRVIVGHRPRIQKRADTLLGELASNQRWQPDLGGEA